MEARFARVRWSYVLPAGLATPVLTQMALTVAAFVLPNLVLNNKVMLIAVWTILWTGICAVLAGLQAPENEEVSHGLLSSLITATIGLIMYEWFGVGTLILCAGTLLAGALGGMLARRERADAA